MAPGEDELGLMDEDDESDDLDDLANPRITEVASDEEQTQKKSKKDNKGKNKRVAEEPADEMDLDDMMSKAKEAEPEQKLSKKQQKKLKKNNGEAAAVEAAEKKAKDSPKSDKKVQFAKNLEQGPTGSTAKKDGAAEPLTVKEVQGIKIDDRKLGSGRVAKKGDRISMRYIGKLDSGKVFDCTYQLTISVSLQLLTFRLQPTRRASLSPSSSASVRSSRAGTLVSPA